MPEAAHLRDRMWHWAAGSPPHLKKNGERKGSRALGTPPRESNAQAIEAMRLNADDFVPQRHKTECIEFGGAHDGQHSTPANRRSRLTFWPLLQQSQP